MFQYNICTSKPQVITVFLPVLKMTIKKYESHMKSGVLVSQRYIKWTVRNIDIS